MLDAADCRINQKRMSRDHANLVHGSVFSQDCLHDDGSADTRLRRYCRIDRRHQLHDSRFPHIATNANWSGRCDDLWWWRRRRRRERGAIDAAIRRENVSQNASGNPSGNTARHGTDNTDWSHCRLFDDFRDVFWNCNGHNHGIRCHWPNRWLDDFRGRYRRDRRPGRRRRRGWRRSDKRYQKLAAAGG